MQRRSFLVGFAGAVAMLSLIASLEVEVASASGSGQPAPINRLLKGDRLAPTFTKSKSAASAAPTVKAAEPAARAEEPKLPQGCHATFGARDIFATEVAGRCVS
jgi:hypothetical protein